MSRQLARRCISTSHCMAVAQIMNSAPATAPTTGGPIARVVEVEAVELRQILATQWHELAIGYVFACDRIPTPTISYHRQRIGGSSEAAARAEAIDMLVSLDGGSEPIGRALLLNFDNNLPPLPEVTVRASRVYS
jgi:hypothetical protein